MTTIVYDHKNKLIACDSRYNTSGIIDSDNGEKFRWVGDDIYFFAGSSSDYQSFIDFHEGKLGSDHEWRPNASAIKVSDGVAYRVGVDDSGEAWVQAAKSSECKGSGGPFALAALDFGKSAKEAVEYAMTRDCYTGGKVRVFDVERMKFING